VLANGLVPGPPVKTGGRRNPSDEDCECGHGCCLVMLVDVEFRRISSLIRIRPVYRPDPNQPRNLTGVARRIPFLDGYHVLHEERWHEISSRAI
jgi:hypothetical protein